MASDLHCETPRERPVLSTDARKHSVNEPIKTCPAEGAHEQLMLTHTRDLNHGLVELLTVPLTLPDLRSAIRADELLAHERR